MVQSGVIVDGPGPRFEAKGRVGEGVTSLPSHRSGLARLRHPARQITDSLRTATPTHTATAA